MFKFIIIIGLVGAFDITTKCSCVQIGNADDCEMNPNCQWNYVRGLCYTYQVPNTITGATTYCSLFTSDNCALTIGCSYVNNSCISFTGCSAYVGESNANCLKISSQCNSDGTSCVQIGQCSTYISKGACQKDIDGKFCYWDGQKCYTPTLCSQLPGQSTDFDCRSQISTCTTDGLQCVDSLTNCSDQKQVSCYYNKNKSIQCFWNTESNSCMDFKCDNAPISYNSDFKCSSFIPTCTTKLGGGCTARGLCGAAQNRAACITDNLGQQCYWSTTCQVKSCNLAPTNFITNQQCQDFMSGCITTLGGGCVQNLSCASANVQQACISDSQGKACIWNGSCLPKICVNSPAIYNTELLCQSFLPTCTLGTARTCVDRTCENASLNILQTSDCENYLPAGNCVAKSGGGCITLSTCDKINLDTSCITQKDGQQCYWDLVQLKCILKTCDNAPTTFINHNSCQTFSSLCTVKANNLGCQSMTCGALSIQPICVKDNLGNNCVWKNQCMLKTCSNFQNTVAYHTSCYNWNNTCTVNKTNNGCQLIPQNCSSLFTQQQCQLKADGSKCIWTTSCVDITCFSAPTSISNDADCNTYMPNCITKVGGGCQPKQCSLLSKIGAFTNTDCTSYLSTCIINSTNNGCINKPTTCQANLNQNQCNLMGNCYFNTTFQNCMANTCSSIESTNNTHLLCNTKLESCTVNILMNGCMTIYDRCQQYQLSQQCYLSKLEGDCIWSNNQCQIKSCAFNDLTKSYSVSDCQNYKKFNGPQYRCVPIVTGFGCQAVSSCQSYNQAQCVGSFDVSGNQCVWLNNLCAIKTCLTAPQTITTVDGCTSYLPECTIAQSGSGCAVLQKYCSGLSRLQCFVGSISQNGTKCFWNISFTPPACQNLECDNAPITTSSQANCDAHISGCSYVTQHCQKRYCEDYPFRTDALCREQNPSCTSNGINCIPITTCIETLFQRACTTDINNKSCIWNNNKCSERSCSNAPSTLLTETDCNKYLSGCTTVKGGGCTVKGLCQDATNQNSCTLDINGTQCIWVANQGICRNQGCEDFQGKTHSDCYFQSKLCTAGINNRCSAIGLCEQSNVQEGCVFGYDQNKIVPCLWIVGKCYQYNGCSSISWSTDVQCKQISPQCTTDGNKCVAINKCANNSISGCITGIDGDCQVVGTNQNLTCTQFIRCENSIFNTHDQCYKATNGKCTTNGINCVGLVQCQSYTSKDNCIKDVDSLTLTNNQKSTGNCVWETSTTTSTCRAQTCTDFILTTHTACSAQLGICTTDGSKCIIQSNCQNYQTQQTCTQSLGTDGVCIFVNGSCRVKTCDDVQSTTLSGCSQQLSTCISDGVKCIIKNRCSQYLTMLACRTGGIDGQCAWTGTACVKMLQCNDADQDEISCQQQNQYCNWTPTVGYNASTCGPHTCLSKSQFYPCSPVYTFNLSSFTSCQIFGGQCKTYLPTDLDSEDCYNMTNGYFYWNLQTGKCTQCNYPQTNNNTNETVVELYGFILGMIILY